MGQDISSQNIHQICLTPKQLESILKQFDNIDNNGDQRINQQNFMALIYTTFRPFGDFSDIIFAIYSTDNYITRDKISEFYNDLSYLDGNQQDPNCILMKAFNLIKKSKNPAYLNVNEFVHFGKLLYRTKPNRPEFSKKEANSIFKSINISNPKEGISKSEFCALFAKIHPFKILRPPSINTTRHFSNDDLTTQLYQVTKINATVSPTRKTSICYKFDSSKIKTQLKSVWEDQFNQIDSNHVDALNLNGVILLIESQFLLPSNFADLVINLFGKSQYLSLNGYLDFRYSLSVPASNPDHFIQKVFKSFDKGSKGYWTIPECIRFGNAIHLNKFTNSKQSWESRLEECRSLYHKQNIDYEYFETTIFHLQK